MNSVKSTHKLTSLVLLSVIISHLFVFHFELESKVLCIGEGNHSHIENIHSSILGQSSNLDCITEENGISAMDNCIDFPLDRHIDEDFAKIKKHTQYKTVQILVLNLSEFYNSSISKKRVYNRNIVQKYIVEQLPTTQLLI